MPHTMRRLRRPVDWRMRAISAIMQSYSNLGPHLVSQELTDPGARRLRPHPWVLETGDKSLKGWLDLLRDGHPVLEPHAASVVSRKASVLQ